MEVSKFTLILKRKVSSSSIIWVLENYNWFDLALIVIFKKRIESFIYLFILAFAIVIYINIIQKKNIIFSFFLRVSLSFSSFYRNGSYMYNLFFLFISFVFYFFLDMHTWKLIFFLKNKGEITTNILLAS